MSTAKSELESRRADAARIKWFMTNQNAVEAYEDGYTAGAQDPLILEIVRAAKSLIDYYDLTVSESDETRTFLDAIQNYEQAIKKE